MVTAASQRRRARPVSGQRVRTVAGVGAIVVLGLLCVGGYLFHWRWSGLTASVTLWDWFEVLALPLAIAAAPLLLRHRRSLHRRHRLTMVGVLTGFAALVLAGYLIPLTWTGFRGNTLWDWLQLVLLPLVVGTTSSLWGRNWQPRGGHLAAAVLVLGVFAVLVIAGYLVPMKWTGFTGNTMWDWLKLLLLPVVVPTVLVPMLGERLSEGLSPPQTADPDLRTQPPAPR
jgi:uncharacterized membrane protein